MSRPSRGRLTVGAAVALAVVVTVGACSKPAPSSAGTEPTAAGPGAAGATATSAAPAKVSLPTGGKCVLITAATAAELVGSSVKSSSTNVTGEAGMVRVDGCTYIGSFSNLGYDINDLSGGGASAAAIVAQAKTVMAAQPGVVPFDVTGGDASVGFTAPVGPKVMARIEVAQGPYAIAVNSVAADPATAKKISTGALAILLAAVS